MRHEKSITHNSLGAQFLHLLCSAARPCAHSGPTENLWVMDFVSRVLRGRSQVPAARRYKVKLVTYGLFVTHYLFLFGCLFVCVVFCFVFVVLFLCLLVLCFFCVFVQFCFCHVPAPRLVRLGDHNRTIVHPLRILYYIYCATLYYTILHYTIL